jgi:hypothetical protein
MHPSPLTSYVCTTAPLLAAGAISARYAGTTMAEAPMPRPTSTRPTTSALHSHHHHHHHHYGWLLLTGAHMCVCVCASLFCLYIEHYGPLLQLS